MPVASRLGVGFHPPRVMLMLKSIFCGMPSRRKMAGIFTDGGN
jgi:hypothetical protein